MVGVIGLSTANIVERIRFAYNVGFRVFQISLPTWGALNDTEVLTFFERYSHVSRCAIFALQFAAHQTHLGPDYRRLINAMPISSPPRTPVAAWGVRRT